MTKKHLIAVSVALVFISAVMVWVLFDQGNDSGSSDTNQTPGINTPEHPDTAEVKKPSTDMGSDEEAEPGSTQYTPVISRISQDSDTVFVRAYVSTFDEGQCALEMTKGTTTVTDSSGVSPQPSYLQCDGFDVDKSEFGADYKGQWSVKVIYKLNGQEYESQPQNFTAS